jgi:hypothetical protein
MRSRIRSSASREDGVALITVLLLSMVMFALVTSSLAYSLGSQNLSRRDQNWNAALAAAEAGLDDYVFRLNENDGYWIYDHDDPPPDGNEAFETWVDVPGPTNDGAFRYDVDTSTLVTQGVITVTSTGRVGNATRTVQASVRRRSFLDFLYFTDLETKDPALYSTSSGDDYTTAQAQTYCAKRYYEGRDIAGRSDFAGDSDGNTCTEISFNDYDTIDGPLHSNDALRVCGDPDFNGDTSTSWDDPTGRGWWPYPVGSCGSNPVFKPGDPEQADVLTMPPTNAGLKAEAAGGTGGCLFTGPTSIYLRNDGTMDVLSPLSQVSNCWTGASLYSTTKGVWAQTPTNMPIPTNGVIYVQSVPTSSADPNYTGSCPWTGTTSTTGRLAVGQSSSTSSGSRLYRRHPLGYPQPNDVTTYNCLAGDVFLRGSLNGQLTIAGDNNIYIVGNTTYASGTGGTDILGLIANNYIEVYHPVRTDSSGSWGTTCDGGGNGSYTGCSLKTPLPLNSAKPTSIGTQAFRNPQIQAALLTLLHSFRVQNYQYGTTNLGNLAVTGAIAQKYRGIVTLIGTSGYGKAYTYDQRLKYTSSPHFLEPVAAAWKVATWIEQRPAYTPTDP